jgi:hypothetical protein
VSAQQPQASPSQVSGPSRTEGADNGLPVSLERIREALSKPEEPLKGLRTEDQAHFRIQIEERQKFQALVDSLKFDTGGPAVPGGIYAYDQQQRLFPKTDNPLVQPYAAFNQGELLTVSIEALLEKYFAQRIAHAVGDAFRERAERDAREQVRQELAAFLASQPSSDSAEK